MELADDLVQEIFLRISPEEPARLVRAALVCRSWCRAISDRGFRRRYRAFHENRPPLLGYFLQHWDGDDDDNVPRFVHTSSTPSFCFSHPAALDCTRRQWLQVLDCRHGRVLILTFHRDDVALIVWDPMTGDQQHVSVPDTCAHFAGAVLCAEAVHGCDHLDCHGGPFIVVLLAGDEEDYSIISVSMYSSETRQWRESNSVHLGYFLFEHKPSLFTGSALYFAIDECCIVRYDMGGHQLSAIETSEEFEDFIMAEGEDGGVRVVANVDNCICVWTQQEQAGGAGVNGGHGTGVEQRAIELDNLLPAKRSLSPWSCHRHVVGYAEGTDTIFINSDGEIFGLDLKSGKANKISTDRDHHKIIYPYMGFYTPDIAKGRLLPP